jgi:hypothetical protein
VFFSLKTNGARFAPLFKFKPIKQPGNHKNPLKLKKRMKTESKNFNFIGTEIVPAQFKRIGEHIFFMVPVGEDDFEAEGNFDVDGYSGDQEALKTEIEGLGILQNTKRLCKCNICNQSVKRAVFFEQEESGIVIAVGLDCSRNVLNYIVNESAIKDESMKKRKKREVAEKIEAVLNMNEGLEDVLAANDKIVRSIASKFFLNGIISDKQIAFVKSLSEKRKVLESVAGDCPNGIVQDVFVVLSHKIIEDEFFGGLKNVLLLENKLNKYKIYYKGATKFSVVDGKMSCLDKGHEITLKGTITQSKNDKLFGFIKRPKIVN